MPVMDILGSFADPLNQDLGAAKLVNCRVMPRQGSEQRLARTRLVGSPGLTQICKPAGASACIALCNAFGTVWSAHANGDIFYNSDTPTPAFVGTVTVNPAKPIIRLAEDRTALCIASNGTANGGLGSAYTATTSALTFTNFQSSINADPTAVCNLDNITVWAGLSNTYANQSDKMYSSDPLAPGTVQPNSFATAEARADPILDLVTIGRAFWPFGTLTVEQWYAQGGSADFAFVAFTNSLIEVGLAERRTLASLHSKVMWVGTDRRVWLGQGQSGQAISPPWIDLLLQQTVMPDLTAYMYAQGGDEFYVLTREGAWTLELALSTMTWAYRQSFGRLDHASRCAIEHETGQVYVGLDTGEICLLEISTASEPAGVLERSIRTMWLGNEDSRHVINSAEVTSYMGPSAGTFDLDWTEDGSTYVGLRTITWPVAGTRRAIARAMGTARRRQIRLTYTGTTVPFEVDEFFLQISNGS